MHLFETATNVSGQDCSNGATGTACGMGSDGKELAILQSKQCLVHQDKAHALQKGGFASDFRSRTTKCAALVDYCTCEGICTGLLNARPNLDRWGLCM